MDIATIVAVSSVRIVATEAASLASSRNAMIIDRDDESNHAFPADPSLATCFRLNSQHSWGFELRVDQSAALSKLFEDDCLASRRLLVVLKTGIGKSHVIRSMGTMLKGVILVIHPLLVLTADQVIRFREGSDSFGSIEAHHLDNFATKDRKQFVKHICNMTVRTTSSVFVFSSPQFLADNKDVLHALLKCNRKHTLRAVAINEADLLARHGSSFRSEIRLLGDQFFDQIFGGAPTDVIRRPFMLALSATMSKPDLTTFGRLTRVGFPKSVRLWGDLDHFQLDCCKLIFHCGNEYKKHLDYVVDYLRADASSAFVFTNRRKLSFKMVAGLEEKLD